MADPDIRYIEVQGFDVSIWDSLGHMIVRHDGAITWDQLQAVKTAVWGADARAIEIYPAQGCIINNGNFRHLWRLGPGDFCPDFHGHEHSNVFDEDNLEHRHLAAWAESGGAFR